MHCMCLKSANPEVFLKERKKEREREKRKKERKKESGKKERKRAERKEERKKERKKVKEAERERVKERERRVGREKKNELKVNFLRNCPFGMFLLAKVCPHVLFLFGLSQCRQNDREITGC